MRISAASRPAVVAVTAAPSSRRTARNIPFEREFGTLKHGWGALPLRVRQLDRVALHIDLTILARLADAVIRAGIAQAA